MENVAAAIEGVMENVPREWNDIRSFHLKLMDSVALPVYQTVPDIRLKIEGIRGEDEVELEVKKEKKEGGQEERKRKKMKGRMREVRCMDIELDEKEGDGDVDKEDARDLEEIENEELDDEKKKRKQGKDLGLGNGGKKKKKKLNGSEVAEDVANFSNDKPSKKLSKLTKQGKVKEEHDDRTKVASAVDNAGNVSGARRKNEKTVTSLRR